MNTHTAHESVHWDGFFFLSFSFLAMVGGCLMWDLFPDQDWTRAAEVKAPKCQILTSRPPGNSLTGTFALQYFTQILWGNNNPHFIFYNFPTQSLSSHSSVSFNHWGFEFLLKLYLFGLFLSSAHCFNCVQVSSQLNLSWTPDLILVLPKENSVPLPPGIFRHQSQIT